MLHLLLRLQGTEVIDARSAEIKPVNDSGVVVCVDSHREGGGMTRFATKFLVGFRSNEVWVFGCGLRKQKPVLECVWVLPKTGGSSSKDGVLVGGAVDRSTSIGTAQTSSSLQACFLPACPTKIAGVINQTLYVYDVAKKHLLNRVQLSVGVLQLIPIAAGTTTPRATGSVGADAAGDHEAKSPLKPVWADASAFVLTSDGDLGVLHLWDECSSARLDVRIRNCGPGKVAGKGGVAPAWVDLRDRKVAVKTQSGIAVWKV